MAQGSLKPLPNYEVVPLRSEEITVSVAQTNSRPVDGKNPAKGVKENLQHVVDLIDAAQGWGGRKDLLCFHEFVLSGWSQNWTRDDCLRIAIDVPGEETEALGKKAQQYNCYIVFGSYAKFPDWPGHFVNAGMVIGPNGKVISSQWKARNIYGYFGSLALIGTTVYDVLDEYVEKYGVDAIWPIARTDIGNIATSVCLYEPEIMRAWAMEGLEVFVRRGTGIGGEATRLDFRAQCMSNRVYGALVNFSTWSGGATFEDVGAGWSCIVGPQGEVIADASSLQETQVMATIPIAAYRKRHSIPVLTKELYEPVFNKYQSKYPPNLFAGGAPPSLEAAGELLKRKVNW